MCCIMYCQHLIQYSRGWHSRVQCLTLFSHDCVCVCFFMPSCVCFSVYRIDSNLIFTCVLCIAHSDCIFLHCHFTFLLFSFSSTILCSQYFTFPLLLCSFFSFIPFFLSFSYFFYFFFPLCRTLWEATLKPSLSSLCPRPGEDRDGTADSTYCVV